MNGVGKWLCRLLPVLSLLLLLPAAAQALSCAVCGRQIHGQYLRTEGKIVCSPGCWEKLLPHCSVCDSPLAGRYTVIDTGAEKRLFCMECAKLPRCFACDLPCRGEQLPDGRTLCGSCLATAVTDPAEAEKLFREVEREVAGLLGSPGCGRTGFVLCDLATLNRGREIVPGGKYELGRCNYEYRTRTYPGRKPEIVSERCTILILDALPRDQFIEVAAHEAAHDWLNHHGRFLPPSWSEGFPEYVASLVNLRHGNGSHNLRMEKNEDPVYGAGFREVKAYADRHGLRKLLEYVRRTR